MSKAKPSVIVPAYNEGVHLETCLKSLEWADEIIVVDGQSQDKTCDIAKRLGAKVVSVPNSPAETQRLKGLEAACHPWFLLVDADETVSPELRDQVEEVVRHKTPKSAYFVLRRNFYRGKPVHLHHPDWQLRLFQMSESRGLPEQIHRIPKITGRAGKLRGSLNHYFFPGFSSYVCKLKRYTEIEASYWIKENRDLSGIKAVYFLAIRPIVRFLQCYFIKKGILDGFFGFFYSLSSALYDVVVAARVMLEREASQGSCICRGKLGGVSFF